jgi:3-methylcrotonyl-CoA carboxylase alpha subunit
MPAFTRVLIANRGEIAVRIIRACRELGLSPVAVYSEADAHALHVHLVDIAYPVGPAPASQSYLRGDAIIAAAQATGAEAIHPGYGFLSENAAFARACAEAGLIFVGPPPDAIEAMGGKIGARRLATEAGVPVVPGYNGDDQRDEVFHAEAERIGFPLLIKASAGGGGKGMRIVRSIGDFAAALEGARRESRAAFGDDTVFLEKLVVRPRHVEIQVLADSHGNIVHLGERECSIQRRHQKIVEESPSPALTPELRAEMGAAAVRAARSAGYVNAGTVEFMLDQDGNYYFLEMNTRLQVEHPVTELVTGMDLVHLQFAIAAGERLPFTQDDITFRGHAIEVRLYAEDPVTYLPATGQLALHDPSIGPGVRVDSGLTTGDEVTVYYDPMIAKLIVHGPDRPATIGRLRRALDDYAILGLTTNLPLLRAIAGNSTFAAGDTHTGFLETNTLEAAPPDEMPIEVLIAAAVWDLKTPSAARQAPSDPFAALWRMNGLAIPLRYQWVNALYTIQASVDGAGWHISLHDAEFRISNIVCSPAELVLTGETQSKIQHPSLPVTKDSPSHFHERFRMAADATNGDLLILWRGAAYRLSRPAPLSVDSVGHHGGPGSESLTSPMPGTLIKVLVSEGQEVQEGQPLVVLEAMKMEHTIVAPHAGIVQRLAYGEGASVAGGVTLVELEELEELG